jgi:hypothetical protein
MAQQAIDVVFTGGLTLKARRETLQCAKAKKAEAMRRVKGALQEGMGTAPPRRVPKLEVSNLAHSMSPIDPATVARSPVAFNAGVDVKIKRRLKGCRRKPQVVLAMREISRLQSRATIGEAIDSIDVSLENRVVSLEMLS